MTDMSSGREQVEILASEFLDRLRTGENPDIQEYVEAHPDLAEEIQELFPMVAAAEGFKRDHTQKMHSDGFLGLIPGSDPAKTVPRALHNGNPDTADAENGPNMIAPYVGLKLGKYTLEKRIGQGMIGSVWLSKHPEFGIPVAVKIFLPTITGNSEEQAERFLREARAAALLNDPHIIRVFDAGIERGLRFLVMEYAAGGSVGDLRTQSGGKLPPDKVIQIASAMTQALAAASQRGIVHRDIKPENILLADNGVPKLADLGLAKQTAADETKNVTATGVVLGTPLYIAPEQAVGKGDVDVRTDIYSLGATLYHLATGDPPFDGFTPFEIIRNHVQQPLIAPQDRNVEVPADLSRIICKMLAKKPEERYQTTVDLQMDLSGISMDRVSPATAADAVPSVTKPVSTTAQDVSVSPPSSTPTGDQSRWLVPFVVTTVVAIVAILSFPFWSSRQKTAPLDKPQTEDSSVSKPDSIVEPGPESPLVHGRDSGGELLAATAGSTGTLRPDDWQIMENDPDSPGSRPRSMNNTMYTIKKGVMRFLGNPDGGPRTFIYHVVPLEGPFELRMVARNVEVCGIAGRPDASGGVCQIRLMDTPAKPDPSSDDWHVVELVREGGMLTCTVDGKPAPRITGLQRTFGRFWILVPSGTSCEIRSLMASGTRMMGMEPGPPGMEFFPPPMLR